MKNSVISITRVVAMMMIVGCHLFSWLGINVFAMILNVGVEIFLLISGYLYANRKIENSFQFLKQRWFKLCVPMYIVSVVLTLYYILFLHQSEVIKTLPVYLLNVQGLEFVWSRFHFPLISELGPLWFLTIIMICYVLLVIVKKIESDEFWMNKTKVFLTYFLMGIVFCILVFYNIQLLYFFVFFIGYAIGKMELICTNKKYLSISAAMIVAMAIRLIARKYMDGSILYNEIIVLATHIVLALWIYFTIQWIYSYIPTLCDKVCENKIWKWLEEHSMMIYITHYMFLVGCFQVSKWNISLIGQLVLFVIFTVGSAILLNVSVKFFRMTIGRKNR